MDETFLTPKGKRDLEESLERLKTKGREDIAKKIKDARDFGDISENAEYDAAKEEQAQMEGEIELKEKQLRYARILEKKSIDTSVVSVGCTVELKNLRSGEHKEYTILGTVEADAAQNRISNESLVGKTLLGHKKGEKVEIVISDKITLNYEIIKISLKYLESAEQR